MSNLFGSPTSIADVCYDLSNIGAGLLPIGLLFWPWEPVSKTKLASITTAPTTRGEYFIEVGVEIQTLINRQLRSPSIPTTLWLQPCDLETNSANPRS